MGKNSNLAAAKKAKLDEFYTRREDIDNELTGMNHGYQEHFEGKTVYCNCDDCAEDKPMRSKFWEFFCDNFKEWKLEKLISTHFERNTENYAYKLEMTNGVLNNEPTPIPINSNGNFSDEECVNLLREADIVATNPPFSLFRKFVDLLMKEEKSFVIVGPRNAVTYPEIFKLLKDGRMWLGYGFNKGDAFFRVPPENAGGYARGVYNPETGLVHFRNCTWFTNLDIPKIHKPIDLRGNYYDPEVNPKYVNYDAIEVGRVKDIPCDWDGVMGVPITFLDQFCPEQFEILGMDGGNMGVSYGIGAQMTKEECSDLFRENKGFRRGKLSFRNSAGVLQTCYRRVLVKNLHPQPRRAA